MKINWSIIIIAHNAGHYLKRCISSVRRQFAPTTYEIVLFQNGNDDRSAAILSGLAKPDLIVIKSARNIGTTRSRNQAVTRSQGKHLLFLDADTDLLDLAIEGLVAELKMHPNSVIAPQLLLADGQIQDSIRRFPTVGDKARRALGILRKRPARTQDRYADLTSEQVVDTAMLACWVMRRDLFERVGPFDERIFYSPEDIDWCLRLKKCAGSVRFLPRLKILHDAQKLSHKRILSVVNLRHVSGLIYLFAKHRYWLKRP